LFSKENNLTGLSLMKAAATSPVQAASSDDKETLHAVTVLLQVHNGQDNGHVGTTLSDVFAMIYIAEEVAGCPKQRPVYVRPVNSPSVK
jgi:hypothetical protein